MFQKIKKFFGFGENKEVKSDNLVILGTSGGKIDEEFRISDEKDVKCGDQDVNEIRNELVNDIRDSGIAEKVIEETIKEYQKRKREQKQRVQREIKEINSRRMSVNDMYMLERFGIKVKRRGGFLYPNFMATNFTGFMIGKNVEDNKIVIFAGLNDVNKREFMLNGRKMTYNRIISYISDGKVHHGYKWYRVRDDGILREILGSGDFYDNESRVWLEDYFNYNEYVRKYREEHPDEKFEIDEIEVS